MEGSQPTAFIAERIRAYEGVRRKHAIGDLVRAFTTDSPDVLADFGEDAAVIRNGENALLLAADGIWSRLMEADPYWAGYCAVLVNIHDIAAMGGRPLAMVDVLSIADRAICDQVLTGMREASNQFGVPIVGGHLHPDTPYSVIDVAILGVARLDAVIYSHTAREGDAVIAAIDLDGRVHPSCILNWDSVTMKPDRVVRDQIDCLRGLGEAGLVSAGKDISNPGLVGTLGMLLEVSGLGAEIDVDRIPVPDLEAHGITFDHWVRMYPGMGFVLTADPASTPEVCSRFEAVGMTAREIGRVDSSRRLSLVGKDGEATVFDLADNGIMCLKGRGDGP
ncbi:MAG: methanogenesis marker 2 protein [Methanospirillum sp.]|nr:methanogenesis marker 2 protein [Methanospirillum sp.]